MDEIIDKFLKLSSRSELAEFLGIRLDELNYLCRKNQPKKCYSIFLIPKKSGETRLIAAPCRQLKYIQRKLCKILYALYSSKPTVHGYIKGRNIVTGARVHVGNCHVLNLDIANFFPSIHFGRVRGMFEKEPFRFNPDISLALTQLVCYNGSLPQGAPTSPIISNYICRTLDNELKKLCQSYKTVYTRYCDDITISTPAQKFPIGIISSTGGCGSELLAIFEHNNFQLNADKIRLKSFGERKMVTGVVVNEKLNLTQTVYRKFRAIIYYTYQKGLEEGAKRNNYFLPNGSPDTYKFEKFLCGKLNYFRMVLGIYSSKYQYLAEKANDIFGCTRFPISEPFQEYATKNIYVIETGIEGQGTAFLVKGLGLVTCLHNVWDIKQEVDDEGLKDMLKQKVKIYHPSNPKRTYPFELKHYDYDQDLLVLNLPYIAKDHGLEAVKENPIIGKSFYFSAGYPNYAPGNSIDWLYNFKVRFRTRNHKQTLYVIDNQFLKGASGGPVFNKENKVIGFIDRGDENTTESRIESAFCLLTPLLNLISN